ncbi:hypothetical protein GIB67_016787 [Kingdonia uniflora]|uniref:Uncharacterized protein n=1 Tax=Kingdonia uniflora TaxID=39325 RepID=A0A7J7LY14_9MAGN|nr:hypothetical protein GIB67_016787 [Kingdonia uniflora]
MKDVYLHLIVRYNEDRITATAVVPCTNPKDVPQHMFVLKKRSHSQSKNRGVSVACLCHHEV